MSQEYTRRIFALLIKFYLVHTPAPNATFVRALEFLGDQTACSPMGLSHQSVHHDVVRILQDRTPDICVGEEEK